MSFGFEFGIIRFLWFGVGFCVLIVCWLLFEFRVFCVCGRATCGLVGLLLVGWLVMCCIALDFGSAFWVELCDIWMIGCGFPGWA